MANLPVVLNMSSTGGPQTAGILGGIGNALRGIATTAAGFALGAGLTQLPGLLSDAAKAAADDEASTIRLNQAIKNLGGDLVAHTQQVNDAIGAGQKLGFTDDDIRDSYIKLVAATGDSEEAIKRQAAAMDLARGAGIPLEQASKLLGKITDENVEVFKRMGITIGDNATAADALAAVQEKFGGQADAYAQSTKGQMEAANIAFDEMKESLGYAILPLITKLGQVVMDNLPAIQSLVDWVGARLSEGVDLASKAFDAGYAFIKPYVDTLGALGQVIQGFGEDLLSLENTDALQLGLERLLGIDSDAIGPAMDALHAVSEGIKGVVSSLSEFGSKILSGDFGGALDMAATFMGGLIDSVKAWATGPGPGQIAEAVIGLADSAWSWITESASKASDFLGHLVDAARAWVDGGGLANMIEGLKGLAEGAWAWVTEAAATAVEKLTPIVESIKVWATDTATPAVLQAGKDLGQTLYDGINAGWDLAMEDDGFASRMVTLQGKLSDVQIPENLTTALESLGDSFRILGGWVGALIGTGAANSGGGLTGLLALKQKFDDFFGKAVFQLIGALTAGAKDFFLAIEDVLSALNRLVLGKDTFTQAVDDIGTILKNTFDPLGFFQSGVDIVSGLIGGIESKFQDLVTTAQSLGKIVPDWVKDILQQSSPSKVMNDIGQDTVRGLINGLKAQTDALREQTKAMMTKGLVNPISDAGDKVHSEVNGILADFARLPMGAVSATSKQPPAGGYHDPPGSSGLPKPGPNPRETPFNGPAGPARPGFTGGTVVQGPYGPYIPSFATGGIVPGYMGQPTLAMVHGGETITPPGQGGGIHLHGDVNVFGVSLMDALNELSAMVG